MKPEEIESIRTLIREEICIAIKLVIGDNYHKAYRQFLEMDKK